MTITDQHFDEHDPAVLPPVASSSREKQSILLKLKIDAEMAHRVYDEFHESLTEKLPCGGFIVSVGWPEDDWVYGTILSYGEYIEVLEPQHVREIIRAKAENIVKKY